jgi:FkbM family methyltransferase
MVLRLYCSTLLFKNEELETVGHKKKMKHGIGCKPNITSPGKLILRSFAFLGHVWEYCRELGPVVGLRWFCVRVLGRFSVPLIQYAVLKPPDLLYPVTVGINPISDEYVFDQLFIHHEYAAVSDHLKHQRVILDLGANVGYASAFLASKYPEARILAVEPDFRNFELCCQNLKPYGDRIQVLKGAVWSICSRLTLSHELGGGMGAQVVAAEGGSGAEVAAWDVPALLEMARAEIADLVKIDIEGSEAELFAVEALRWLPRVRNICIELHDQQCRDIFFEALTGFDYELVEIGESTMCLNLRAHISECARVLDRQEI